MVPNKHYNIYNIYSIVTCDFGYCTSAAKL